MSGPERIAVTGLGAVTPYGMGVPRFWDAISAGKPGIGQTTDPELRRWAPVAAEVRDFDAGQYLSKKLLRNTDRVTHLALVAAAEAIADSDLGPDDGTKLAPDVDPDRIGISLGTAFGGVQSLEAGAYALATGTSKRGGPRLVSKSIPNAPASAIAMHYRIRGPVMTYATACASSANSIGEAVRWLRCGEVDAVLAGGAECLFSPAILAGLNASSAIALKGPDDYGAWSRPFATDRLGMVMGEGAAVLVLETVDRARARGAKIYAELAGYGTSNDAYHETAPDPTGAGAILAINHALRSSGLNVKDIDYVNAHATATISGDLAESRALRKVFGEHLDRIPVSSIKGAVGHMLGAAGAIESIACIKAMETALIPPTLNCEKPDPESPPDVVPLRSRKQRIRCALSNSFGFGGQNGVLVWQEPGV